MGEEWADVCSEAAIDGGGSKLVRRNDSDDWVNVDETGGGVWPGIDAFTTRSRERGFNFVGSEC